MCKGTAVAYAPSQQSLIGKDKTTKFERIASLRGRKFLSGELIHLLACSSSIDAVAVSLWKYHDWVSIQLGWETRNVCRNFDSGHI
jgi:hypothetical protein